MGLVGQVSENLIDRLVYVAFHHPFQRWSKWRSILNWKTFVDVCVCVYLYTVRPLYMYSLSWSTFNLLENCYDSVLFPYDFKQMELL